jgi:hypothetical protein
LPAAKHRWRGWKPSEDSHLDSLRSLLPALGTYAGRSGPPSGLQPSPSPADGRLHDPEVDIAAVTSSAATAPSEHPASLTPRKSRSARDFDTVATQPQRLPEAAPPMPAQTTAALALRSLSLPIGTLPTGALPNRSTSPGPRGHGTSQVRTDGVTQEGGLLRQALAALRHDHDGRRALALLDDYDRRFRQGVLALEANSARAQALLQLGDKARALEILDHLPLWHEGYTGELRVIRGELRSLSGRCREALLDFDPVLSASNGNASDEVARALFGRASCRARTGDLVGAEQDRQHYLKEFPQGPATSNLGSRRRPWCRTGAFRRVPRPRLKAPAVVGGTSSMKDLVRRRTADRRVRSDLVVPVLELSSGAISGLAFWPTGWRRSGTRERRKAAPCHRC